MDAAITGEEGGAKALPKRALTFCVGGSEADVAEARPILERMARFVFHVGPLGAGQIVKMVNNMVGSAAELWGKATNVSWAVIFPTGGPIPRHPSQLYEACLEGLVLFVVLAWLSVWRSSAMVGFSSGEASAMLPAIACWCVQEKRCPLMAQL